MFVHQSSYLAPDPRLQILSVLGIKNLNLLFRGNKESLPLCMSWANRPANVSKVIGNLKGQSNEIFYLRFFHRWTSPKPLTRYLKIFSNLASNSRRYSRFLIDSPLLLIAESQYSPYCFIRRVVTLRFIIAESHYLLELSASATLACRLIRRVDTPRIVYYGESLLPASFIAESHC